MMGKCKRCGYQAGVFGLKNGVCKSCVDKQADTTVDQPKTTGDRLKSSLLVGLIVTVAWMVLVLATGAWDPRTLSGFTGFFGNAFGIFFIVSGIAFIVTYAHDFGKLAALLNVLVAPLKFSKRCCIKLIYKFKNLGLENK